jgi:hypothetical protein
LRSSDDKTREAKAPFAGYWQPTAPHESQQMQAWLATILPGLYQPGEAFDSLRYPPELGRGPIQGLVWQRFVTVRHNHGAVEPIAAARLTREIALREPHRSCNARKPCPLTGIWQPWLPPEHPLQHAVNQPWRQAWVVAGQPFPDLQFGGLLPFDPDELTWHLLDSSEPKLV